MPVRVLGVFGIVDLMIQKGIGAERTLLYVYYERPADFEEE
jgi:hypothetical protein